MNTLEVMAWMESYCESQGIKPNKQAETAISKRIPLSELKQRWQQQQQAAK